MTHSFLDDPVKQLWREKVIEFVRKQYGVGKLSKLKVLCMPGSEMGEVLRVWDELGVRRKNIYGVEYGDEEFAELEARVKELPNKQRIRLYNGDVADFLRDENTVFDIINLDYCSYFSRDVGKALNEITQRQRLAEKGILGVNVLERRETKARQRDYLDISALFDEGLVKYVDPKREKGNNKITFEEGVREFVKEIKFPSDYSIEKGIDLRDLRQQIFTRSIALGFQVGINPMDLPNLFPPEFLKSMLEIVIKFFLAADKESDGRYFREYDYAKEIIEGENLRDIAVTPNMSTLLQAQLKQQHAKQGLHPSVAGFIYLKYKKPYFVEDVASYRYASQPSGSPMICDLFYLDQRREWFNPEKADMVLNKINGTYKSVWKNTKSGQKKIRQLARNEREATLLSNADYEEQRNYMIELDQKYTAYIRSLEQLKPDRIRLS
ncbi:class I SAM-dependent methyltransferase [Candidatus Woesearchaeota archaeon]|jgi:hypothetical protein|nr:class I SAM-dependent methyltransferase [Candidatus Woesearchaeota archaeon]MBT5272493.1 class I SAM-dependent methyltransferase [Candidatus Woesearchaeota archaeon]MBT6041499.1 class I SAM-dependent methyltransferase [Candidatus Woesearchaeota archaeon]MBT6336355.1 class I SAM-dependent methyltransferase [Candidatus Woesearchaeota archaeon]MBT7928257.1 class I SAM-dependent methyltransferase [Candidatus Woesearchaeota archaeon]